MSSSEMSSSEMTEEKPNSIEWHPHPVVVFDVAVYTGTTPDGDILIKYRPSLGYSVASFLGKNLTTSFIYTDLNGAKQRAEAWYEEYQKKKVESSSKEKTKEISLVSEQYFTAADGAYQAGRSRDYADEDWDAICGPLHDITICVQVFTDGSTALGYHTKGDITNKTPKEAARENAVENRKKQYT